MLSVSSPKSLRPLRLLKQLESRYRQVTLVVAKALVLSEGFLDIVPILMTRHCSQGGRMDLSRLSNRIGSDVVFELSPLENVVVNRVLL